MSTSARVTDAMVHAFDDAYSKNWEAQRHAPEGAQELGTFFATRAGLEAALSAHPSPGGQGDALVTDEMVQAACKVWAETPGQGEDWMRTALQAALAARQPVGESFQAGVAEWMGQCFLPSLYSNMTERGDRLLEEVLELLQAHGYDKARVPTLVDYVFSRPVGDPAQEVGGVMVTLAGYCWVAGLDMHVHGHAELARISHPEVMAKIRAKQEAKNALHFDTPLPGHAAAPATAQAVDLPYSLDADPAGIRARVCDVITGTLMVGAQGHTPPPAGHWAEPFWKAARADANAQAGDLWQPIETAPKNGSSMLLGHFNSAGNWRTVRGRWFSAEKIEMEWENADDFEAGWYEESVEADDIPNVWPTTPTHWQPLPAAPSVDGQAVGNG